MASEWTVNGAGWLASVVMATQWLQAETEHNSFPSDAVRLGMFVYVVDYPMSYFMAPCLFEVISLMVFSYG
jgi:hypothetical protein